MSRLSIVLALGVSALPGAGVAARQSSAPALADLLGRLGAYVAGYQLKCAGVIADESYVQDTHPTTFSVSGIPVSGIHRELGSDVLMLTSGNLWMAFRDVYVVNGRPVRDHDRRLEALFQQPNGDTLALARRLADESARYNIGHATRNINVPMMALVFALPANQPRSQFSLRGSSRISGVPVREVRFNQSAPPTIIKAGDQDQPITGSFWIDPDSGRVVRTRLQAEAKNLEAVIDVNYGADPKLGVWVPVRMDETYRVPTESITATAKYSNVRKFSVDVSAIIKN